MDILDEGIYQDLSNEAYHQQPALNKSMLKDYGTAASPTHFVKQVKPYTKLINLGSVIHLRILEPHLYDDSVVKIPPEVLGKNGSKNTNAYREWQEIQDKAGKFVIKESEAAAVDNIMNELLTNPTNTEARELLTGGLSEVSFFWQSMQTFDYPAKCRPDHLPGSQIVTDLKTTGASAAPLEFGKVAAQMKYHWSAAWTLNGVSTATGVLHKDYRFVVIEQDEPYGIMVYRANEEDLLLAWMQINQFLPDLIDCIQSDKWPGYPDGTHDLQLPYWEKKQIQRLMNEGGPIYE